MAAAILVGLGYWCSQLPKVSEQETHQLASRFHFTKLPIATAPGHPMLKRVRQVHPSLEHISAWISSLGAAASLADLDGDGLSNVDELARGTNPTKRDTDGDGCNDCSSGSYDLANDGPDADQRVYDFVVQARVGMVDYQRDVISGKANRVFTRRVCSLIFCPTRGSCAVFLVPSLARHWWYCGRRTPGVQLCNWGFHRCEAVDFGPGALC